MEPCGPVEACNGTALPLPLPLPFTLYVKYLNFILIIYLYRITMEVLSTICNTRSRNFQSTNNYTCKQL